jgi:hypothetical protein
MSLTYTPQLRKAIKKRRAWPVQQFGQANDYYTFGGATGCTQTVLQALIHLWFGTKVSQDTISRVAGYPLPGANPNRRGLRPSEVMRVVNHYHLPYKVVFGMPVLDVAHASKLAPVGFGHIYGWWPEWKGYHYGGTTADGHPNGYATPTGHAGRTQLKGFNNGPHFGLLLGYAADPDAPDLYYAWEPNHNSASRPEKPPYDRMTYGQFTNVYESYRDVGHRSLYALVPTRTLPAAGY